MHRPFSVRTAEAVNRAAEGRFKLPFVIISPLRVPDSLIRILYGKKNMNFYFETV